MRLLKKSLSSFLCLLILLSSIPLHSLAATNASITITGTNPELRVTVSNNTPGALETDLALALANNGSVRADVTVLSITGTVNAADLNSIYTFSMLPSGFTTLKSLDLSEAIWDPALGDSLPASQFKSHSTLKSVALPISTKKILNEAFKGCNSLNTVNFHALTSLTDIGDGAFQSTGFVNVDLSKTAITALSDKTFNDCFTLTSVDLTGLSLTSIGDNVFEGNIALKTLDLSKVGGGSPLTLGDRAFSGCYSLESVNLTGSKLIAISATTFSGTSPYLRFYVASENYSHYAADTVWATYIGEIVMTPPPLGNIDAAVTGNSTITVDFDHPINIPAGLSVNGYEYSTDNGITWENSNAPAAAYAFNIVKDFYGNPLIAGTTYDVAIRVVYKDGSNTLFSGSSSNVKKITMKTYDAERPSFDTNLTRQELFLTTDSSAKLEATLKTLTSSGITGYSGTVTVKWYKADGKTPNVGYDPEVTTGTQHVGNAISLVPDLTVPGIYCYYAIATHEDPDALNEKKSGEITQSCVVTVKDASAAADSPVIVFTGRDRTYTLGETPTDLVVSASSPEGGDITYKWHTSTTNDYTGTPIVGGTGTLTTPKTNLFGINYYYVEVTNTVSYKGNATTLDSNIVAITVTNDAPDITSSTVLDATYLTNATTTPLAVTAAVTDGGTLSVEWFENSVNNAVGGTSILQETATTGATPFTSTLDLDTHGEGTKTKGIRYYYAVVTNTTTDTAGVTEISTTTSNIATIVVDDVITPIDPVTPVFTDPVSATYIQGTLAVPLSVNASVTDSGILSYVWYSNTTGIVNPAVDSPILNAINPIHVPLTATAGTTYYYVVITNTLSSETTAVTSAAAKITVTASAVVDAETPVISKNLSSADNATYAIGDTATELSVTATDVTDGGTLSYQWYKSTTATATPSTDVEISSATDKSYTPNTTVSGTDYYYVVVTNKNTGATGNPEVSTVSGLVKIDIADATSMHTVTFMDDTQELSSQKVISGETVKMPENPEKDGYKFLGWYSDKACTTAFDKSAVVTKDLTVYAKWEKEISHKPYIKGIDEKTFAPSQSTTRAQAAQMFFNLLEDPTNVDISKAKFDDVNSSQWFCKPVLTLNAMGVISGDGDGKFRPNDTITRGEFASMVQKFFNLPDSSSLKFPDVTKEHWAWKAIGALSDAKIANGYEDGSFGPQRSITRAEVVVMLNTASGRYATDISVYDDLEMPFTDVKTGEGKEAHWAWRHIIEASVERAE